MAIEEKIVKHFTATCDLCSEKLGSSVYRNKVEKLLVEHRRECPKEDHRCDNCDATKDRCSTLAARRGRGCCEACFTYDTHHMTLEASAESLRRAIETERVRRAVKAAASGG